MNPSGFGEAALAIVSPGGLLGGTLAVLNFVMLLYLITYFSLVVKRGALLLALVIWLVAMASSGFGMLMGLHAGVGGLIVILHVMIVRRLETSAGAE